MLTALACTSIIAECISARLWIEDLFSQSMYVCTCVHTWWVTLRNVTWNVVTYRRPYSHMCVTQSDTFR